MRFSRSAYAYHRVLMTTLAVLTTVITARAEVIHVPGDQPSIGAAIAAAQPGDTVLVADGTYTGPDNRDMTYGGKAITVRSENGPAECIIDCENEGRAFIFDSEESNAAILEGFTIINGIAPLGNGGGVDIALSSHPTIRNCVFRDCSCIGLGGGMAVRGECVPIITGCTFINNVAFGDQEGAEGGGLCLFFLSPATVRDCVFLGNFAVFGGGLACALSDATVANCLFVGNDALIGGGGAACDVANPRFVNCTFAENAADYGGGVAGISFYLESNPVIENSILWGDGPDEIEVLNGVATVRYSDVQGGWAGTGNINANPAFEGDTLDPLKDFQLSGSSPCIDAGDNTAVPGDVTTDLAGNARFVDDPDTEDTGHGTPPIVDMGALEYQVQACPADFDGDGDVDTADLLFLLSAWDTPEGDVDGDGDTDTADLLALLAAWGECPE
ncbi:MAG: right-handed parallel beta-helix repeat-containing protein [Planctomycetota bacterium]|nr:right-handed parallel beta-helix repeat-containing protein [Planctomycetota bacterium]